MSADRLTSVYQYFDGKGQLLYVGVTARGVRRAKEHAESKVWWPHAATCTLEHYESRHLALAREELLIHRYGPPYNTVHNHRKAESLAALKLSEAQVYTSETAPNGAPVASVANVNSDELFVARHARAVESVLAAGVSLKDRRTAYYALPKDLKKVVPCIHCGLRPGHRGPECRPCLMAAQAERRAERDASTEPLSIHVASS